MPLIVEDGTGLSNADSYASVDYANNYHFNLGNDDWSSLDASEKEQNLRKATNYLIHSFRGRIKGSRVGSAQRLDWPRTGVFVEDAITIASNVVPDDWKDACCELAMKASTIELMPDSDTRIKKEKIDAIEVTYDETSAQGVQFTSVNQLLSVYLTSSSLAGMNLTGNSFAIESVNRA